MKDYPHASNCRNIQKIKNTIIFIFYYDRLYTEKSKFIKLSRS